jgi:predicted RND superfamily exporter protein
MSRLDLINPNSGFNRLWLDYIDEFGDNNEAIVVVEGQKNDDVIAVIESLSSKVAEFPDMFQGVLHGVDLTKIHRKGLHYVPLQDLETIQKFVAGSMNALASGTPIHPAQVGNVAHLLTTLSQSNTSQEDINYFLFPAKNGVIGFVLLRLVNLDKTKLAQGNESIGKLRSIVADVRETYPSTHIGLTGMPILENDEMELSNQAMTEASILALVGVAAVFMAGFGGIRHPLLALIALLVAFAWTMGYITLAVGHLNILSIAFGAMLIGLGTDFSVHYLARYLDLRRTGLEAEEALCQTAEVVGPGILTGALTTSAAFYAASFAEFTGVSELGTIAGGGILFCAVTTFVLFPALIILVTPNAPARNLFDVRGLLSPVFSFPKTTLVLFAAGFIFLLYGIPKVWYDHNLLHLQPEGLESVKLEEQLLDMDVDHGGKNVWFALSIADTKEELLERKKIFESKYPALKVEEIVSLFPEADPTKIKVIQSIADMLQSLPVELPAQLQNSPAAELVRRLQTLKAMAIPEPPTTSDLPDSMVERFVGKRGKQLMRIYTTANIWNMDELEKFVKAVRDVDPKATGSPLQTYESSLQMQQGFITAACYAFGAILVFLLIDFRSFAASFSALFPMFLGFIMMFGVIGWLDLPLNPANMIVLPLILGIGIDDGVHLIHDYRSRRHTRYKMSASTATSILVTSLTTIIGFGSMMIASHRGLQSLGRVLVIGVTCCLLASIVILPILLALWTRNEKEELHQGIISTGMISPAAMAEKEKRLTRRKE